MTNHPPKCHCCKRRLFEIFESDYKTYVFVSASGTYQEHEWKGETEIFCPYCNARLYDIFPAGVCNYLSRTKLKR